MASPGRSAFGIAAACIALLASIPATIGATHAGAADRPASPIPTHNGHGGGATPPAGGRVALNPGSPFNVMIIPMYDSRLGVEPEVGAPELIEGSMGVMGSYYQQVSGGAFSLGTVETLEWIDVDTKGSCPGVPHDVDLPPNTMPALYFPGSAGCPVGFGYGWPGGYAMMVGYPGWTSAWVHEVGHFLGMLHAASGTCTAQRRDTASCRSLRPYGDSWDPLGTHPPLPSLNALHLADMGWGVDNEAVGTDGGTFVLAPLGVGAAGGASTLSLPYANGIDATLEFRAAVGIDSGMAGAQPVVRALTRSFALDGTGGGEDTLVFAELGAGGQVVFPTGYRIEVVSATAAGAEVRVSWEEPPPDPVLSLSASYRFADQHLDVSWVIRSLDPVSATEIMLIDVMSGGERTAIVPEPGRLATFGNVLPGVYDVQARVVAPSGRTSAWTTVRVEVRAGAVQLSVEPALGGRGARVRWDVDAPPGVSVQRVRLRYENGTFVDLNVAPSGTLVIDLTDHPINPSSLAPAGGSRTFGILVDLSSGAKLVDRASATFAPVVAALVEKRVVEGPCGVNTDVSVDVHLPYRVDRPVPGFVTPIFGAFGFIPPGTATYGVDFAATGIAFDPLTGMVGFSGVIPPGALSASVGTVTVFGDEAVEADESIHLLGGTLTAWWIVNDDVAEPGPIKSCEQRSDRIDS